MKIKNYILVALSILGVLVIASFLSSCSKTDKKNTVVVNITSDPGSLDPNIAAGTWEHWLFANIFEGLVVFDKNGKIIPGIASSWQTSNAGKTYTFKLRDTFWSDGVKVTAHDFEFSMKRVLNPTTAATYANLLYIIKGAEEFNTGKGTAEDVHVKALDDNTLQIDLTLPAVYFVEMLEHPAFLPLPKHIVEKYGKDWVKVNNLVYNGAYKLTQWKLQNYLMATKNEYYYDASNVKIENIKFVTISEANNALESFRTKEIDFAYDFPADKLDLIKQELPSEWFITPYSGIYFYSINLKNTKVAALSNKEIRQALAMSIDREFLVQNITKAGEVAAYSIVPLDLYKPTIANSNLPKVEWANLSMEKRMQTAKEILERNGYTKSKPLQFNLSYNTLDSHKKIAIAIAKMWEEIGVKVNFVTTDVNVHYDNLQNNNFDVGRAGWIADYQEPSTILYILETASGNNYSKYSNREFDRLVTLGKSLSNEKARFENYIKAEKLALEDSPIIPLYYYVNRVLSSTRIQGFVDNISGVYMFKYYSLAQ